MIDFIRSLKDHMAYGQRLSGFLSAFLLAEFLFKFHSFTLECVAFLATWLIFDWLLERVLGTPQPKPAKKVHPI